MSRGVLGSLALCCLALLSLAHGALQHSPPLPGVLRLRAAHRAGGCSSVHAAEDAARERKAVKQGLKGAPAEQTEEDEEEEYDDTCAQQMLAAVEIAARRTTLQRFAGASQNPLSTGSGARLSLAGW